MPRSKRTVLAISAAMLSVAAYAISPSDNLGTWRSAAYSEQTKLCEVIVDKLNQPGLTASSLCSCISESAGDGGVDFMKVSETAAACAVLLK